MAVFWRGMDKSEIETPALVIDLDRMQRNLSAMLAALEGSSARIRPHAKSHKTPQIAAMQMAAGAVGVTCAKVGEAEGMVNGGIREILISSQLVGENKTRRAAELASRCNLSVACDTVKNVQDLSARAAAAGTTVGIVIETEIGMKRCGASTHELAVDIAGAASSLPGVEFRGIMGYEGHCVEIEHFEERQATTVKAMEALLGYAGAIRRAGIPVQIVSAGGTGTYNITGRFPGVTDVQVGSFMLMDSTYRKVEGINFEQALTCVATVISRPSKDLAVLDCGLKSLTAEQGTPQPLSQVDASGRVNVYGIDGAYIPGLSEEHARLRLESPSRDLNTGDKVEVVPTHSCTTMNTHDVVYVASGNKVVDMWKITGRGAFV